jgi:hypothetical protein
MNFATIWEREVGDIVVGTSFLENGTGVVVASQRAVRMFDFEGEMQWRFVLKSDFRDIAPLPDGDCVIACKDRLSFLDARGKEKRELKMEKEPFAIGGGETIGFLSGEELHILDLDGTPVVRAALDSEGKELALNRLGFVVASQTMVESIEAEGSSRWRKDLESPITSLAASELDIYVASEKTVRRLDRDGNTVWSEDYPDLVKQVDAGEILLVVLEDAAVLLNRETNQEEGRIQGKFSIGSVNKNALALARDKMVIFLEDTGDEDVFYEIVCRGKRKCGSFASSKFVRQCPKCGAQKIILRVVKKKLSMDRMD